jgi:penicillin-binding protein 2
LDDYDRTDAKRLGRRGFLKSLFGLSAVAESEQPAEAGELAAHKGVNFYWANLRNGQVAFPTGMNAVAGQPGSVMKLITAAALLESGLYTGEQTIECRSEVIVNKQSYKCLYPHGRVDLVKAIGLSCNVFFAQSAQHLTSEAVISYARRFGLDRSVAGYPSGEFPDKILHDPVPYALGLARELKPNALQMLRLAALVATCGKVPPLHNAAEGAGSEQEFVLKLAAGTWHALQQGMRICEREGTARKLDPPDKLKIAAKTGTTTFGSHFQSWLIGYFPVDAPKYAFCLRSASGTSQERAVPEARKFLFAAPWPM